MIDFLSGQLSTWLLWLGLGGGTIGIAALAIFAPSVLQIIGTLVSTASGIIGPMLKPVAGVAGKVIAQATLALWEGALDVLDNGKTIAFVACVAATTGVWVHQATVASTRVEVREEVIKELRQDYRFVPKRKPTNIFGY